MIAQTESDHSLLTEFETTYVRAGSGKRFANLIIDTVAFNILTWLAEMVFTLVLPELISFLDKYDAYGLLSILYNTLLFSFFIFFQESMFSGKSIGKFITRLTAVNYDGTALSTRQAMLRALTRAIPFEAFSALGTPPDPWHDRWTDTMVIDEQKTAELSINSHV